MNADGDDFSDLLDLSDPVPPAADLPKRGRGRAPTYRPEFAEQARRLCDRMGATDSDLAYFFGVSRKTIDLWAMDHLEFGEARKVGKEAADERVERAFYHRAVGFWTDTEKIFMPAGADTPVRARTREYFPPDVAAATFWLKNRKSGDWRDRKEIGLGGETPGSPISVHAVPAELTDADLAYVRELG